MAVPNLKRDRTTRHAADTVAWAHDALELTFGEIGLVVDADERTVRRWREAEVAPRARHQASLDALVELRHLLGELFESPEAAAEWLNRPIRAFRGQPPVAMIRRGRLKDVVEVLATMESGAFV